MSISPEVSKRIDEWLRNYFLAQRRGEVLDIDKYVQLLDPEIQTVGRERWELRRREVRGTLQFPASNQSVSRSAAISNSESVTGVAPRPAPKEVGRTLKSSFHAADTDRSNDKATGNKASDNGVAPSAENSKTFGNVANGNSGRSDKNSKDDVQSSNRFSDTPSRTDDVAWNEYSTFAGAAGHDEQAGALPDPGSELVGYEIISELGRGAFGVVYCAQDVLLDRRVAIKIPILNEPSTRQQYIDEARKAVRLEHPGIVPIYHVGTASGGQPFVVQKLIEGPTLRELLNKSGGVLPIVRTVRLILSVCRSVTVAHAAGMVHRDLKPENLLIDGHGNPWVADFGLALLEDEQSKRRGEVAGTPLYMSPEQLQGRTDWLDGRSDIWAIGVMLYEMICGKAPFEGRDFAELQEQILHRDPRPLHQRSQYIPKELDEIFQKCCAKKVNDRYASANQLAAELEQFLETTNLADEFSVSAISMSSGQPFSMVSTKHSSTNRKTRTDSQISAAQSGLPTWAIVSLVGAVMFCGLATCFAVWMSINRSGNTDTPSSGIVDSGLDTKNSTSTAIEPKRPSVSTSTEVVPAKTVDIREIIATNSSVPEPPEVVPDGSPRTFRVSQTPGKGTHSSLKGALDAARDGDTIYVLAGTYLESLEISKSIHLIGEGDRKNIKLKSVDTPCVTLKYNVQVRLSKLHLESHGVKTSTIDLHQGSLELDQCELFATSLDCIKVAPGTSLTAGHCRFDTAEEPAIQAELAKRLIIHNSSFHFSSSQDIKATKIGIQVIGCGGTITDCSFLGRGRSGIDWRNTPTDSIRIEGCTFKGSQVGLAASSCENITLASSPKGPNEFSNCGVAIFANDGHMIIENASIVSSETDANVGILITEDASVQATACIVSGYSVGIRATKSVLEFFDGEINECQSIGIQGMDASLTINKSKLTGKSQPVGILLSGKNSFLKSSKMEIAGPQLGFYLVSGYAELVQTTISDCVCGISIGYQQLLVDEFKLKGLDGEANSAAVASNLLPELDVRGLVCRDNSGVGIQIFAPCNCTLVEFYMLGDKRSDKNLALDERLERINTGDNSFTVRRKIGSSPGSGK